MLDFPGSRASVAVGSALAGLLLAAFAAANTITVNSASDAVSDDGACTLREAFLSANTNAPSGETPGECAAGAPGHDTILFAIPGAGVHTIQATSAFPVITEPVTIDGYSQPGAARNTKEQGRDAIVLIEINGHYALGLPRGLLEIEAGSSTVTGLKISEARGADSIALRLTTNGGNTVAGNSIGHVNNCNGISIESSSGNTVGGPSPADRNFISNSAVANSQCVELAIKSSSGNQVINNYIGTEGDQNGYTGILISSVAGGGASTANVIGGTIPGASNLVYRNGVGVTLRGPLTSENIVQGNSFRLIERVGVGIKIDSSAHDNRIGGTAAGAGNRIDNAGIGVSLDLVPSPAGSGNAILGNLIDSNFGGVITLGDRHGIGIDLKADGPTANDPCDADAGPNGLQNFPVITLVKAGPGTTTIRGTLDAAPSTVYRLEFFADNFEGIDLAFLGPTMVTTDPACHASFEVTFPVSVAAAAQITATATDDHNNTSELSQPVGVQTQFFTLTPCRVADTRDPEGPSGGPPLTWGENRTFPVTGICGIPPTARAVAVVGAAFEPTAWGDLLLYPHSPNYNQLASFVNFRPGITQSNFGIVPLGIDGKMTVHCNLDSWSGITHFFFDVYGYYQ